MQRSQDVIVKETKEIESTESSNHAELAQLYVSRGENYLLDTQYQNAIEDFQKANSHLGYSSSVDTDMMIAFRVAFGEAVGYDNLGIPEKTQQAMSAALTASSINHVMKKSSPLQRNFIFEICLNPLSTPQMFGMQ